MTSRDASDGAGHGAGDHNDRRELAGYFSLGLPVSTRRDLLRMTGIGAAAMAGAAVVRSAGAVNSPGRSAVTRFQADEIEQDAEITMPLDPYGQPVVIDPHRAPNWGPFWVMYPNIWGGLLRYDEYGAVELDLASDMQVSDDGKLYTFTLRDDARYASGNRVKAADFVDSWKRALKPGQVSPMSDFMSDITGYSDFISGASTELGVAAPDDQTVELRLRKGFNYFPSLLASYVYSVIDPAVLEEFGEEEFYLHGAGTGPWQVSEFDPATQLVMTPNEEYYDGNSPSLAKLTWIFLTGPESAAAALDLYEQDQVVSADVPVSLKATVEADEILSEELQGISPAGSVRALFMDFLQPPFDDVRVRLAVAHAIDREKWANEIWEGTWQAAGGFSPPVLAEIGGYEPPEGAAFDPEKAAELLADAGFDNGDGMPSIICYRPVEQPASETERLQALFDMIKENSGIDIQLDASKTAVQVDAIQAENGGKQIDEVWWWNLYETPHLLNEVFSSDSPYMRGYFNWNADLPEIGGYNPGAAASEFEGLADDVDYELDEAIRNDIALEAETLVLENAVAIPLGYWVQQYLQKPYLQGTRQGPWTGRLPVLFDKEVVVLKH